MRTNLVGFCTWNGDVIDPRAQLPQDVAEFRCIFAVDSHVPVIPFERMMFPEWSPGAQCGNGLLSVSVRTDRLPVDLRRDWAGLIAAVQSIFADF